MYDNTRLDISDAKTIKIKPILKFLKIHKYCYLLNLSRTPLRNYHVEEIVEHLTYQRNSIKVLNLAGTNLTHKEIKMLCPLFTHYGKIAELDLSDNPIGEEGFRHLIHSTLKNNTLSKLDLRNCSIVV